MRKLVLLLAAVILVGCTTKTPEDVMPKASNSSVIESYPMTGSDYLRYPVKLKGSVSGKLPNGVMDTLKFELYIDSNGNGEGLAGHGKDLYQVNVLGNEMYFWVSPEVAVKVTDVSGRLNTVDLSLTGVDDLSALGFSLSNNIVSGYTGVAGDMQVSVKYAPTDHQVKPVSVHDIADATISGVLEYVVNGTGIPGLEKEQEQEPVVTSNFEESKHIGGRTAISIEGTKYNIGDTCNPADYFQGRTPTGLVPKEVQSGASGLELLYVTWQAPDGIFEVVTVEQKVISIHTTCQFGWIGFKPSTFYDDVREKLGANLTYTEQETWRQFDPELECTHADTSLVECTYRDQLIKVGFNSDQRMTEYRATRDLPYLKEES